MCMCVYIQTHISLYSFCTCLKFIPIYLYILCYYISLLYFLFSNSLLYIFNFKYLVHFLDRSDGTCPLDPQWEDLRLSSPASLAHSSTSQSRAARVPSSHHSETTGLPLQPLRQTATQFLAVCEVLVRARRDRRPGCEHFVCSCPATALHLGRCGRALTCGFPHPTSHTVPRPTVPTGVPSERVCGFHPYVLTAGLVELECPLWVMKLSLFCPRDKELRVDG